MTAAIFGLIGVIVGGALNAAIAMATEAHRDGRAVMAAARLLVLEAADIGSRCKTALDAGTWGTIPQWPLETVLWEQYRTIMASHVTGSVDWLKLSGGFTTAVTLNQMAEGKEEHQELTDSPREMLKRGTERANESMAVLSPLVRGEHLLSSRVKRRLGLRKRGPAITG